MRRILRHDEPLRGRSFARGREMFDAATCIVCHNIRGEGKNFGADLSHVGEQYATAELLRHILEPSLSIKDEHRLQAIELTDESRYFGLIIERDDETIRVAEKLQEPEDAVLLDISEISSVTPLDTSPMPSGLLVTLTLEEIVDLLAYVASNGDEESSVFDE